MLATAFATTRGLMVSIMTNAAWIRGAEEPAGVSKRRKEAPVHIIRALPRGRYRRTRIRENLRGGGGTLGTPRTPRRTV